MIREERRRKKILKYTAITLGILAAVVILCIVLMKTLFVIRTRDVTGCVNSDPDAVIEAMTSEEYSDNSLLLFLQLKNGLQPEVPFVESVQMSFVSPWHITLEVTEKELCGVMYDEETLTYTYFDSEGTVLEISQTAVSGPIEVQGTTSGDASVGMTVPLLPEDVIDYVIEVFGCIEAYDLTVRIVEVDSDGNIYFDTSGITVMLGPQSNTASKFENLALVLPQLGEKSGTLDLSTFESAGDDIIFTESEDTSSDS